MVDGRRVHGAVSQMVAATHGIRIWWHGSDHRVRRPVEAPSDRDGGDAGEKGDGEASEVEDGPKGELPSGRVISVHEKVDKDEEKKVTGKLSTSYPPVFRARQGEGYRDWKRSVRFWMHG